MVDMDRFWKGFEEGYEVAKEGILYAAELAEGASARARVKMKIFAKKRRMERYYAALGMAVYEMSKAGKANPLEKPDVKANIRQIEKLEADILNLLKDLEKGDRRTTKRKKPAAKTTPKRKTKK